MTVTLLDGRQVDSSNLFFDRDTYHVTLAPSGEDVTNNMRRSDKQLLWSDFDVEKDNARLYNEQHGGSGPSAPLNESTASIFFHQITTDPLAAPLDSLNAAIDKAVAAPAVKKLAIAGAIVVALVLLIKLSK